VFAVLDRDQASAKPHVLYVAWVFPPSTGGGVYRTLATANTLVRAGFRVTVLTAEAEAFKRFTDVDESLEERIDSSIRVVRLPFEWPYYDNDIRRWPRARALDPDGWLAAYRKAETETFPEPHFGPWYAPLIAAAERLHAEDPVDLVVGSANPNVDFAVGRHLFERADVPYVMDFRDAWRLDYYGGGEAYVDDPRVAEIESRYIADAHEVWFVNEPIREWHQAMYPAAADKMRIVENGFDVHLAPTPVLTGPEPDRPLTFTYIGTIGPRVPMAEMIDGWVAARRRSDDVAAASADIWGHLTASGPSPTPALLSQAAAHGLQFKGPVAKTQVADVYGNSDVLLLILSAGRYVTSGKVYEYMASALPIVSVHEPGNAASDILRSYPLWVPADDLTVDGVADALVRAAALSRSATAELRQECAAFVARYERSLQLVPPISDLYEFVRGQEVKA
jgi:glycosyltransferase involved in cell wall biosynthesis